MNSYHLGFPVKVLGAPLRSHDSRHNFLNWEPPIIAQKCAIEDASENRGIYTLQILFPTSE